MIISIFNTKKRDYTDGGLQTSNQVTECYNSEVLFTTLTSARLNSFSWIKYPDCHVKSSNEFKSSHQHLWERKKLCREKTGKTHDK